jgi:hypothetical protein
MKVFGPGCVLGYLPRPPKPGEYDYGRAGYHLVPAPDADPATWFVNALITFKKCAACGGNVIADETGRMAEPWSPKRRWSWKGRNNRTRRLVDTKPGPHPAGTYACHACRDGEPEPFVTNPPA